MPSWFVVQDLTKPMVGEKSLAAASTKPLALIMTSSRRAVSETVRAMGPGESWLELIGTMPSRGIVPTVGLIPTHPLRDAGQTIDPSVSLPTARATSPAAIAAPVPEDDPPAECGCFHGFAVRPPRADQPLVDWGERIFAHSERLVAPMMLAPALRNRRAIVESCRIGKSRSARDPALAGRPTASTLSLIKTGSPASGSAGLIDSAF